VALDILIVDAALGGSRSRAMSDSGIWLGDRLKYAKATEGVPIWSSSGRTLLGVCGGGDGRKYASSCDPDETLAWIVLSFLAAKRGSWPVGT